MYKTSGHLPYYAESMFPPMWLVEEQERKQAEEVKTKLSELEREKQVFVNTGQPLYHVEKLADFNKRIDRLQSEVDTFGSHYYLKAMNSSASPPHFCGGTA